MGVGVFQHDGFEYFDLLVLERIELESSRKSGRHRQTISGAGEYLGLGLGYRADNNGPCAKFTFQGNAHADPIDKGISLHPSPKVLLLLPSTYTTFSLLVLLIPFSQVVNPSITIMGFGQSKPIDLPRATAEEKVLRNVTRDVEQLSMSDEKKLGDVEEEYIPSGVSVSEVKGWEDALVKDPKVSLFHPHVCTRLHSYR